MVGIFPSLELCASVFQDGVVAYLAFEHSELLEVKVIR